MNFYLLSKKRVKEGTMNAMGNSFRKKHQFRTFLLKECKKFYAAKTFAFSFHFTSLLQYDLKSLKMCEPILKKYSAPIEFNFCDWHKTALQLHSAYSFAAIKRLGPNCDPNCFQDCGCLKICKKKSTIISELFTNNDAAF